MKIHKYYISYIFVILAALALAGCGAQLSRASFSAFVPEVLTSDDGFDFPAGYQQYVGSLDNQRAVSFTDLSVQVGEPAQSVVPIALGSKPCATSIVLIDQRTNQASSPLTVGYGGSGASTLFSPAFTVPAKHGVLLAVIHGSNCAAQARDLNLTAEYEVQ